MATIFNFFHKYSFKFFLVVILFGSPTISWAFKISPCLRVLVQNEGKLGQEKILRWNMCGRLPEELRSAVHEHMTLSSIRDYKGDGNLATNNTGWKYEYMIEDVWEVMGKPHQTHAIMYGAWWNDDPLMLTWGQGFNFAEGAFASKKLLKSDQKEYSGSTKGCKVKPEFHLGRESHYGKLQHLHFMTQMDQFSSSEDRVESTRKKALNWMKFAYQVATGELKPLDPLTPQMEEEYSLPPISKNVCAEDPYSIKIWTLFSRSGWTDSDRILTTPDVALGSMFHILQDSWSPSHTCRVLQDTEVGELPLAVLKDVKNYSEQISEPGGEDMHSLLDLYPPWLTERVVDKKISFKNDPITVGTWLLSAVDQNLPWEQVETYLRNTIFATYDKNRFWYSSCLFESPSEIEDFLAPDYEDEGVI